MDPEPTGTLEILSQQEHLNWRVESEFPRAGSYHRPGFNYSQERQWQRIESISIPRMMPCKSAHSKRKANRHVWYGECMSFGY